MKVGMVLAVAAMAMAAAQPPVDERDLEAALHRQIVLGDLRGAMEQYRAILARPERTRPVAARALFQIGECLEKSGQAEEAYNTYRRVAAEYSDQPEIVAPARIKLAAWSAPHNLRFEEGVPGKVPPGWLTPSLGRDTDNLPELSRERCHSRTGCAIVMAPANMPKAVGNLMQSFSAAAYRGKTVRLRAWLRLETAYVTATGIRLPSDNSADSAQLWLTVERANRRRGFSDNMDDRPVRSGEWTEREIVGSIDDDAQFIRFGVMCIGGGRAWVDDVSFEVISQ
jgi:hypothetical protein